MTSAQSSLFGSAAMPASVHLPRARRASSVDPWVDGTYRFQGQERPCKVWWDRDGRKIVADVKDVSGRQLQGFEGTFGGVLAALAAEGVVVDAATCRTAAHRRLPAGGV